MCGRKTHAQCSQYYHANSQANSQAYYSPPNQELLQPPASGRGCCSHRGHGFRGRGRGRGRGCGRAPGLFGLIANRMRNRNENSVPHAEERVNGGMVETPQYGTPESAYHGRDVKEPSWESVTAQDGRDRADRFVIEQKSGTKTKNEVEGIGQRRIDEALRAGRRYESIVAPPEYSDAW